MQNPILPTNNSLPNPKEPTSFTPYDDGQSLFYQNDSDESDNSCGCTQDTRPGAPNKFNLFGGARKPSENLLRGALSACAQPKSGLFADDGGSKPTRPQTSDADTSGNSGVKAAGNKGKRKSRASGAADQSDLRDRRQLKKILKCRQRVPRVFVDGDTGSTVKSSENGSLIHTEVEVEATARDKEKEGEENSDQHANGSTNDNTCVSFEAEEGKERSKDGHVGAGACRDKNQIRSSSDNATGPDPSDFNHTQRTPKGSDSPRAGANRDPSTFENEACTPHSPAEATSSIPRLPPTASQDTQQNRKTVSSADMEYIVELRKAKTKWREVQRLFEARTGLYRSERTLRHLMRTALKKMGVDIFPEMAQKASRVIERKSQVASDSVDISRTEIATPNTLSAEIYIKCDMCAGKKFPAAHERTASKSWNDEAFQAYLKLMREEADEEEVERKAKEKEEEQEVKAEPKLEPDLNLSYFREPSPVTSEDLCYWAYQVQRKTWQPQLRETEDEAAWIVVGSSSSYPSLQRANQAAGEEVLRERNGCALGPDVRSWTFRLNEDDMAEYSGSLRSGDFKVAVTRFLRNKSNAVPPSSKIGWMEKRVYEIRRRKVERVTDDVYKNKSSERAVNAKSETNAKNDTGELIDGGLYTILDQANREAGRVVLSLTTNPGSTRIDDQLYRIEATQQMRKTLDELEEKGGAFAQTIQLSDTSEAEVYVCERKLNAPRNI